MAVPRQVRYDWAATLPFLASSSLRKRITMLSKKRKQHADGQFQAPTYGSRYFTEPVPRFEFPTGSMPADAAYQICHDELNLDGNPALNLASFVTTWMEPEAEKLIAETLNKNYVDQDEYPRTTVIQER